MSEYQSHEFVALDRPLSAKEMAALRAISSRAEISPTRFWNEYHWGDLKADPAVLLARYFDAHVYAASWGTRRLILRLPAARVDLKALRSYAPGECARVSKVGTHVVLDVCSEAEGEDFDAEGEAWLATLAPLRAALLQGDLSAAYLAWLLAVETEEVDDDAREPPVPAGLGSPGAALSALVEFLRVDPALLEAAAEGSEDGGVDPEDLRRWVKKLPAAAKDRWLLAAVERPGEGLGSELIAAYRKAQPAGAGRPRRTVGELRARAEEIRDAAIQADARRAAKARARAEADRRRRLDTLAREGDEAWSRLGALVAAGRDDAAVQLTLDLRAVASATDAAPGFEARFEALRKQYPRRRVVRVVRRALTSASDDAR